MISYLPQCNNHDAVYIFLQNGYHDSKGFIIKANQETKKSLNQSSRKITNQLKKNFHQKKDKITLGIMDKIKLDMDYRYYKANCKLSNLFYLVKISVKNEIKIMWIHKSIMSDNKLIAPFNKWKQPPWTIPQCPTQDTFNNDDNWGHAINKKYPSMVRITTENISNLGINANNNPKQEAAMEWLYQNEVDIAG